MVLALVGRTLIVKGMAWCQEPGRRAERDIHLSDEALAVARTSLSNVESAKHGRRSAGYSDARAGVDSHISRDREGRSWLYPFMQHNRGAPSLAYASVRDRWSGREESMGGAPVVIMLVGLVFPTVLLLLAAACGVLTVLWAVYRLWHDEWSVRMWHAVQFVARIPHPHVIYHR